MKICDVCCEPTVALNELRDQYKSDGIEELCEACEAWANAEKTRLAASVCDGLRNALIARKAIPPQRSIPWWERFVRLKTVRP